MVGVVLGDGYYGDGSIGNQCGGDGGFGLMSVVMVMSELLSGMPWLVVTVTCLVYEEADLKKTCFFGL